MILSWLLAITATPVLGKLILRPASDSSGDPYDKFLFRVHRAFLEFCMRYRLMTIVVVIGMFVLSLFGLSMVKKIFFPSSTAMYFIADELRKRPDVKNITSFIGQGSLRFMLTYSPPDFDSAFSELMVEINDGGSPQEVLAWCWHISPLTFSL